MIRLKQIGVEVGRIVRFGIVGVVAAAVYFGLALAIAVAGAGPVVATIVGHVITALISYFGHLQFSFAVEADHSTFVIRFVFVALVSLALNVATTWTMTSVFG